MTPQSDDPTLTVWDPAPPQSVKSATPLTPIRESAPLLSQPHGARAQEVGANSVNAPPRGMTAIKAVCLRYCKVTTRLRDGSLRAEVGGQDPDVLGLPTQMQTG